MCVYADDLDCDEDYDILYSEDVTISWCENTDGEGQFEVSDHRSPGEVFQMIASRGYEPVWKDWDQAFLDQSIGRV